ncbi:MAG: FtsX-like permease family protein [Tunicatimonas sp.]
MTILLRNYLTVALRSLRQQKMYSLINGAGLALSVTSALLLFLYVTNELGYDRYHAHADRIYRVAMDLNVGGEDREVAVAPAALAPTLASDYADVEQYAIIRPINDFNVVKGEETFSQADIFYASATVFDIFTYPLLVGDPQTALQEPNSIVIDQRMADRYFPGQEALGQIIQGESDANYQVTGVMQNIMGNGHFTPQALVSIWDKEKITSWGDWNWANYVRLAPPATPESFREVLDGVYQTHLAERAAEMKGSIDFVMQPLTDIHFYSRRDFELRVNDGNMNYIYTFSITAFLLLLIACINYTNLATARSLRRAKEVGVRKALGSLRSQLIGQFLVESYLIVGVAVLLGIGLAAALLPAFNQFTQKSLRFDTLATPATLGIVMLFVLVLGLVAGGYPAFFLSRFNPVKVLKGGHPGQRTSGFTLRQALVVFQFVISITMLIGTWVIYQQLHYLNRQSLGFNPEQIVTVPLSDEAYRQFLPLKQALLQHDGVQQLATARYPPGKKPEVNSFHVEGPEGTQDRILQQLWVDHDFLATLDISLVSGRNFSERDPEDTTRAGVLVNEALVKSVGWTVDDAIGRQLSSEEWQDEVIGVVKDFHMLSLHDVIEPLVIRNSIPDDYMLLRISGQNVSQTLAAIRRTWNDVVGKTALDYQFLDQQFAQQYEKDEKRGSLFAGFSALTVFIACLGLFGLASYTVSQRAPEIGIRKVLGASVPDLLGLLVRNYIRLVVIALFIAVPVANYFVAEWLANFAYQTEIRWWFFALPGGIILLVALLSVGHQTWRAARANPVDSLRDE